MRERRCKRRPAAGGVSSKRNSQRRKGRRSLGIAKLVSLKPRDTIVLCMALAVVLCLFGIFLAPMNTLGEDYDAASTSMAVFKWELKITAPSESMGAAGEDEAADETTDAWVRYRLTDAERLLVAQVVTAEGTGEPFDGKAAIAQCVLNACELEDLRPAEVVELYQYTDVRPHPSEEALEAVSAVFDRGYMVTTEAILWFYAPDRIESLWHESQSFVIEIAGHRFFSENKSNR